MTVSDDLNFSQNTNFDEGTSSYPVAFGITFTPKVIGLVVGGLGVLGAVYMILNIVMPEFTKFQDLQTKSKDLQGKIEQTNLQAKQADKLLAELAQSQQQQSQVLALLANEKSLETLLIDTSRLVSYSNATAMGSNAIRAKLKKFAPAGEKPEIIIDNSLGEKVNNKLKRQVIKVEIEGNFEQTQAIMRNIERLQPLLLVQNYDSKLMPPEKEDTDDKQKGARTGVGKISTSFDLVALMPLTAEEQAEAAAKAAPPPK
ncbi:pilus assembly protein PilO [Sphaerospermopsis torques-reginae]|uniref:Pilus assembly protein PilO n=1 Tax=Sphaerospermopsis torques-reginae ITEP-024 TaxID=984208 RepID=A0ABX8WZ36_9CYAN|nr:pilus assembly protein PilO [Sphaerospermopsis torques-reginae]QYX31655.1 pilus assembly protein PilO [Sphaerospermopsis torques-reginae ITEP-024]